MSAGHPGRGGTAGGAAAEGPLRVAVAVERCVASGQCAQLAPAVFDQGESDGVVVLLDPAPPAGEGAAVRMAEEMCPVGAIRVGPLAGPGADHTKATERRPADGADPAPRRNGVGGGPRVN
ncbi:ferredoxin [Actinoalloteichus caeruleus]|uniref:Ferredoxin n=1 Tax=Actinoalloteichus caeruleus DSM 43889 TaxID=1120930 RepID=A0ABT1JGN7_ACTCY|nr:ferredoxin [Actinoalloteichus caeruleus]MCP2331444.1 Ferredoxin [Actinoalloteichus caeruleus DSM 43889]